jgi:tetratricopeptide (TPR) repeat protein
MSKRRKSKAAISIVSPLPRCGGRNAAIGTPNTNTPRTIFLAAGVIVLATFIVYWQVHNFEFVNYDDPKYVTENPHVTSGIGWENIGWAFTTTHASNWHPLTWLSHIFDCQFLGLNSGRHHVVNLFLHAANAMLMLLVFYRMTRALWPSAFVAAAFALHPLHVESVAWIAERKDVLSTFFWLLTIWAYVSYARRPCVWRYLWTMFLFALGLTAKSMLVTVPFVLLLLDYWPLRRFGQRAAKLPAGAAEFKRSSFWLLVLEKAPLVVMSLAVGVVTLLAQENVTVSMRGLNLYSRTANALVSYAIYLWKMIWPVRLAVFYPHTVTVPIWQQIPAGALLAAVSIAAVGLRRRYPYLLVGWLWYIGTLLPVIGLVQAGLQQYADRYTYVPLIGIFVIIAWGLADILQTISYRKVLAGVSATIVLSALAARTYSQAGVWRNNVTLYQHALAVTPDNHVAHNNLGIVLKQQGKTEEAIEHFRAAVAIFPAYGDAIANLASALLEKGQVDSAIAYCTDFLRDGRDHVEVRNNLANALRQKGDLDGAAEQYRAAIRLRPDAWQLHYNLALVLADKGRFDEAIRQLEQAQVLAPGNSVVKATLGNLRAAKQGTHPFEKQRDVKP